jgi:hypothetical protein
MFSDTRRPVSLTSVPLGPSEHAQGHENGSRRIGNSYTYLEHVIRGVTPSAAGPRRPAAYSRIFSYSVEWEGSICVRRL